MANLNHQFDVKINEHYLERAKTYKYLGIDLDESLSWDSHIDSVVKKASAGLGAIKRVRNLVPRETLITIIIIIRGISCMSLALWLLERKCSETAVGLEMLVRLSTGLRCSLKR